MKSSISDSTTPEFEGITYTWKNVNAKSKPRKPLFGGKVSEKHILHEVTGIAKPGEVLAIMGASGAGKTTLLNVLTFRNVGGLKIGGDTCVNGVALTRNMLMAIAAYVQQDDLFIGSLTVREHLMFQARLQMQSNIPIKQRVRRVEQVIEELGLAKCADTQIGIPGRLKGISGGEKKRLSFASEVLTDPPLMLCDEPTSGLDSYMAESVVSVLQDLAKRGKTIICTIHQPSSQVYSMFDKVLLMSEGRTAYLGQAREALSFFSRIGYDCPSTYNPSDYFIEILAIQPSKEDECRARSKAICSAYQESDEAAVVEKSLLETMKQGTTSAKLKQAITHDSPYKATWFSQFYAVFWRTWIASIKDPMILRVRLILSVLIALIFGVIFFREDLNQSGIQNLNGALFLVALNSNFQNVSNVVNSFCSELSLFKREHFNGMYSTHAYYLGKTVAELPSFLVIPLIFYAICYWMMGFAPGATQFILGCVIILLLVQTAVSIGYVLSTLTGNVQAAMALTPILLMPFAIFGGFFQNTETTPVYFIWVKYISWFYYANEALSVNQWEGIERIECDREFPLNSTCLVTGEQVLDSVGFKASHFEFDIVMLGVLMVALRILSYLLLLRRSYER